MRLNPFSKRTWLAAAVSLVMIFTACAGSDPVSTSEAPSPVASTDADTGADGDSDDDPSTVTDPDSTEPSDEPRAETTADTDPPPVTEAPAEASNLSPTEAAEANEALLQPSEDARDIEVLSVSDGSIATLRNVVSGDRPVLLWFWAPH